MPEKTAFLPSRRPTVLGRAQGMSGVTPRQSHERTKRTTNRSETGLRTDGLENAPRKRLVSQGAVAQDPTRFKSDLNDAQYMYNNQPTPGIHSFHGAYTISPAISPAGKRTNEELERYGFRQEDRRGQVNRMGNPGRMNVRADALNQGVKLRLFEAIPVASMVASMPRTVVGHNNTNKRLTTNSMHTRVTRIRILIT